MQEVLLILSAEDFRALQQIIHAAGPEALRLAQVVDAAARPIQDDKLWDITLLKKSFTCTDR
jgi:hypothetical protein